MTLDGHGAKVWKNGLPGRHLPGGLARCADCIFQAVPARRHIALPGQPHNERQRLVSEPGVIHRLLDFNRHFFGFIHTGSLAQKDFERTGRIRNSPVTSLLLHSRGPLA